MVILVDITTYGGYDINKRLAKIMDKSQTKTRSTLYLSKELWRALKVTAFNEGVTMSELASKYIFSQLPPNSTVESGHKNDQS